MPIVVDFPDGHVMQFSDATPESEIRAAVRRYEREAMYGGALRGRGSTGAAAVRQYLAGVGGGARRWIQGAGNFLTDVLPDSMEGVREMVGLSDRQLQQLERDQHYLRREDLGGAGATAGEVITSMLALRGAGAALGATRASTAFPRLARAVASPVRRAAIEGAVDAGATARSDRQVEGALGGAALGAGINRVLATGGRVASGLVRRSREAEELATMVPNAHIPLAQAAADDPVSQVVAGAYRSALPLIPGVSSRLARQGDELVDDVTRQAYRDFAPDYDNLPNVVARPGDAGRTMQRQVAAVEDATIGAKPGELSQYTFGGGAKGHIDFDTFTDDIAAEMRRRFRNLDPSAEAYVRKKVESLAANYRSPQGGSMTGDNLLAFRNALEEELARLGSPGPGSQNARRAYGIKQAIDELDREVQRLRTPNPRTKRDVANSAAADVMADIAEPRRVASALAEVGEGVQARGARMQPSDISRAGAASNSAELDQLGTTAARVTERPLLRVNREGQMYFGGSLLLGGFTTGVVPAVTAALVAIGIGHGLASRMAQKALMGDTAMQRKLMDLINNEPAALEMIDRALRVGANQQLTEE